MPISQELTVVSAILIVIVLIIAFNLRGKIKRNESGNEFFPWERAERMKDFDEIDGIKTDRSEPENNIDIEYDEEYDYEDEYNDEDLIEAGYFDDEGTDVSDEEGEGQENGN